MEFPEVIYIMFYADKRIIRANKRSSIEGDHAIYGTVALASRFKLEKTNDGYVSKVNEVNFPIGYGFRWFKTLDEAIAQRNKELTHKIRQLNEQIEMWQELANLPVEQFFTEI